MDEKLTGRDWLVLLLAIVVIVGGVVLVFMNARG